ncbi:MAG: hypothetical protein R6W76_22675 [Caldilinea sp.]
MTATITIEVTDELRRRLKPYESRLADLLDIGLRQLAIEIPGPSPEERELIDVLASQPTSEQVLALRPSSTLQARLQTLLEREKSGALSSSERAELDRYLLLEHWVRLAKTHALQQIARQ